MARLLGRSVIFALMGMFVVSLLAVATPTFTDQGLDKGYLNPTDKVAVQEIRVTNGGSTISSISIRNLGTADEGNIAEIVIDDDSDPFDGPIKTYTSLTGIRTGLLFSLNYTLPSGTSYIWVGIRIKGADHVAGGETIHLRVRFYSGSYTSPYVTDGKAEEIAEAGFEEISDGTTSTTYFNPGDAHIVQQCTFTDDDGNNNPLHIQTGSATTIAKVENLGSGDTSDISKVRLTLDIDGSSSNTGWHSWTPASPMDFHYGYFVNGDPLPNTVPDDGSVKVTVEMEIAPGATDEKTIHTRVTLLTSEGEPGSEEDYVQAISSTVIHMIRRQGFEESADASDPVASGVVSPGEGNELVQKVTVTDDDLNNNNVTANAIWIKNDGTAEWADIEKIVVKRTDTDTTLHTINTGTDLSNWQLFAWASTWPIDDDGSGTIAIYYEVANDVTPGRTLRPVVKIRGNENGTNYEGDEVPYPDYVELQPYGLETVTNETPPSGGTAYSGQRLLAQKIKCDDQDENADEVRINPVQIKNDASAPVTADEIAKIEICNQAGDTLGETTELDGINDPGGVTVSTTQNNKIPDNGEMFLCIYVTFAGPEDVTAGHHLKLKTSVFFEENGHAGSAVVNGDAWTLEINHRPEVDFTVDSEVANLGEDVTFTPDVTDPDGDDITDYDWDFGDGDTSTDEVPTHVYDEYGTFDVTLIATDERGATGTVTKQVVVNRPPEVDFTWDPEVPDIDQNVAFTADVNDPDDPDDTPYTYAWDFDDDGEIDSTQASPTHQFPEQTTYDVTLTVTDSRGGEASVTHLVVVGNKAPEGTFTWEPVAPDVGETVTFTPDFEDPDDPPDTPFTYEWDFDNDGEVDSTVTSPTYAFREKKNYTVKLTVTDSRGGRTEVSKTLSVGNEPPTITSMTADKTTVSVGEAVQFTSTATDTDGTVEDYAWDFRDGTTSSLRSPTHTYMAGGTYTVTLVVTDDRGAESEPATLVITVEAPERVVTYSYPNPAATQATIVYYLPEGATDPVLRIFNITGALVFETDLTVGEATYVWDLTSGGGNALPNGLYMCVVRAKNAGRRGVFKLLIDR